MSLSGHDKGPVIDADGWLVEATHRPSPHCDERPPGIEIDLIVVHGISLPPGRFGGDAIDALFCGRLEPSADPELASLAGLRVSAHLLIRRTGELVQYVPFPLRASHAGQPEFAGRTACNYFSIGIQLEGCDDIAYEAAQYRQLTRICDHLMTHYPAITPDRITGHCHIAPDRKTDPGPAFDWDRFRENLRQAKGKG